MGDNRPLARTRVCAVIDDDASVRDSLGILLETHGFEARLYGCGSAFLATPDRDLHFVIIDQHMPGMAGLDVVEALRCEGLSIPTILITGRPDAHVVERAKELGVPVLEKPFVSVQLLELIGAEQRQDL